MTTRFEDGLALHQQDRLAEAERIYEEVLGQEPDHFDALHLLGVIALRNGKTERGVELILQAVTRNAGVADAWNNLAIGLTALDRHAEAVACYDRAIALRPHHAETHFDRGIASQALDRHQDAVASYDRAIGLRPDHAEAYSNRGIALHALGRREEAVASYDRAIALNPDYAVAYCNRGNALWDLNRPDDAIASYDRAIALRRDYAKAHANRGNALQAMNRHAEAIASYDRAMAARPDDVEAYYNQGLCRLAMGDFERGWRQFESRWLVEPPHVASSLPQRLWLGDFPIDGRTILVVAEHGLGDSLQFCRYLPLLGERADVVLEVPLPLRMLLGGLRGVRRVIVAGEERPRFDVWTPMMSLPLAFRTTLATVPSAFPYLHADSERSTAWGRCLSVLPGRKVGLVWAGSSWSENPQAHALDRRRSIALRDYGPLAAVPGISLISLQKGEPAGQARTPPAGMMLHDWTKELEDFADTAALVEALDLVISVDTSVVHLAGALGKPVWVLNRYDQCWRWLRDRIDSPWYPSARLFRQQTPGDWAGVIRDVVAALRADVS